tara:strand:- start:662 stop:772 length:111 start_codon:yes stop_codon:yes gene_type:complete
MWSDYRKANPDCNLTDKALWQREMANRERDYDNGDY